MSDPANSGQAKKKWRFGKLPEILAVLAFIAVVAAVLLMSFGKGTDVAVQEDHVSALEARLSTVLSQIEGAGKVDVVINTRSEGELVVAMETTVNEDGSITTVPVLVNGDVVILEEKYPEITGVLIVSEGADDLGVRFSLLEAAASVLDINQSIIKVYAKAG